MLVGVYAPPAPEAGLRPVTDLEATIGRRLDIVHFYQAWSGPAAPFRRDWLARAASDGRMPLLTWEPWVPGGGSVQPLFSLAAIAHGRHDVYIRAWAAALRDYGRTVYLRPMHEMNGDWYPWAGGVGGNTPALYVTAWRRLRGLLTEAGAFNVRLVWSVNATDVPAGNTFERYWPGADQVDVLGLDGYNWGSDLPGYGGWRSFDAIFGPSYTRITRLGPQPVWVTETACDERGGDKAAWVRAMLASTALQRLQAIVWFNLRKERDWPMTSSSRAALAFSGDHAEPPATDRAGRGGPPGAAGSRPRNRRIRRATDGDRAAAKGHAHAPRDVGCVLLWPSDRVDNLPDPAPQGGDCRAFGRRQRDRRGRRRRGDRAVQE